VLPWPSHSEHENPSLGSEGTAGAMTRDELVLAYQAAVKKCAELVDRQEASARLLSTAVHDLRNPISSVLSSCDYLIAYCLDNLDPEQVEMITRIQVSARTLLDCSDRIRGIAGQMAARASG
jgi:signal transduction histidine kinase